MRVIADFHIHSKYSRAVSKKMDIDTIAQWARWKGIDLVGTGDFTHAAWLAHIKEKLAEDGTGLLKYKDCHAGARNDRGPSFILTSEISSIYKQGGKTRKVHTLIFAPDIATVEKINSRLALVGNLHSDGRPILGLPVKDLAKIVLDINPDCMIIPAHAWTPWFSIFGSKSGFDSIEECFGDYSKYIYAIETGLSSDPEMNWRVSALDNITLISNSDAHSPANLGREANVFEIAENKFTYKEITDIIKTKDNKRLISTIEFFPEEGKYHFDGHANCKLCINPFEKKYPDGRCPICRRPMTIGVASRVQDLADRKTFKQLKSFPASKHLVPLREIIASAFGVGVQSKKVNLEYHRLIKEVGPEFSILLDHDLKDIPERIAQGIINVRSGDLHIDPGYDGIFGKVHIFKDEDIKEKQQKNLF